MEFNQYEKAIAKYHNNLKIINLPLMSWEFYSSFFNKSKDIFGDLKLFEKIAIKNEWNYDWKIDQELKNDIVIVITDIDLKIVYASKNIIDMNGYNSEEVVGNFPKIFQGELTDIQTLKDINLAIKQQKSFDKKIINYSKDGSFYLCHIKGHPVFNKNGELINFIAFETIAA